MSYSREQHLTEQNDLEQINVYLRKAVQCLTNHFDQKRKSWPYAIVPAPPPGGKYSFSTNAMTAFALATCSGKLESGVLLPTVESGYRQTYFDDVPEVILRRACEGLVDHCLAQRKTRAKNLTQSGSFGLDDPFTLSWLLGLKPLVATFLPSAKSKKWSQALDSTAGKIVKRVIRENRLHPVLQINNSYQHAFPLLRVVHVAKSINQLAQSDTVQLLEFFRNRLHEYLAYFLTNNSRFDAAELVFSLEALLQCDLDSLDEKTLQQAFTVIEESQQRNLNWRPLRPFIANDQGAATLPLSVEIASSLLRVCSMLDRRWPAGRYFSRYVQLFNVFTGWVFSSTTHGKAAAGQDYFGWSSEHVYEAKKVHVWQTSQVLLYLLHFGALLARHSAMESLRTAKLELPRMVKRDREYESLTAADYWNQSVNSREPIEAAKGRFRVYEDIASRFIGPRSNSRRLDHDAAWSMILYGPPGTGKTALAEEIARSLKWPLLSVSPSDFVADGEGRVEERAKDIFDAVSELADCVILFDEIDRLILDRDSRLYEKQGDIFQFMTPGMLTKIHELRARERSIFIIGTNYNERIDPAIKRVGRIDKVYALMPPDVKQRRRILNSLLSKYDRKTRASVDSLAGATWFNTYGELKEFVKSIPRGTLIARAKDLAEEMHGQRAIRLLNYRSRFRFSNEAVQTVQEPYEEFLLLLFLLSDAGIEVTDLPKEELEFLKQFVGDLSLGDKRRDRNMALKLNAYLPGCADIQKKVLDLLTAIV